MFLNAISNINELDKVNLNNNNNISKTSNTLFEDLYKASIELYNETNDYQIIAKQQEIDYVTGKTDDVLAVIMAQEKASSSLNFTVQVTNKIVEVYNEIMRMQV